MDNWIDLDNLPQKILGKRNIVDWEHSAGHECSFLFDNVSGTIKIHDAADFKNTNKVTIMYNNELFYIHVSNLKNVCCEKLYLNLVNLNMKLEN